MNNQTDFDKAVIKYQKPCLVKTDDGLWNWSYCVPIDKIPLLLEFINKVDVESIIKSKSIKKNISIKPESVYKSGLYLDVVDANK